MNFPDAHPPRRTTASPKRSTSASTAWATRRRRWSRSLAKRLSWASPSKSETDTPTSFDDLRSTTYNYRLYFDPAQGAGEVHPVIAGEWLGDSRRAHPDFVVLPVEPARRQSANIELNRNQDVVEYALGLH